MRTIADRYVKIWGVSRYCRDCGRFHELGQYMHYSVAAVFGELRADWFCVDCQAEPEFDRPLGFPLCSRWGGQEDDRQEWQAALIGSGPSL